MKYNFRGKVLNVVAKIPKGKTSTYKEVARRAGSPRAYRAVGNILNKNYADRVEHSRYNRSNPKIPCHRVIRSDGKVGGYRGGTKKKIEILKAEGVII